MTSRSELEHLYHLKSELAARRADDALYSFEPLPHQQRFIDSILGLRASENWLVAANRAGKTLAASYTGATLARFGDRGLSAQPSLTDAGSNMLIKDYATSGWVISLDFPTSRDIVQPLYFENGFGVDTKPFIPAREIEHWWPNDSILRLKNGSIIGFKSADSGRKKFQGVPKDWIHFDEEPPKEIYQECVIRVGKRRIRLFGSCTLLPPEGQAGGVSWLYSEIIVPVQKDQRADTAVFTASIYENPHILRSEIRRLESIYPEGSVQRRIRLNGELLPGLSGARAYPAFDSRIHVISQPPLDLHRPLCWIWDFNVSPMVSLVGQRRGTTFHIHTEFVLDEGSIPELCQYFRDAFPTHRAEIWVYGDATGKRRNTQTDQTDYTTILNEMRRYPVPLRLKVPTHNPEISARINSVNRALRDEDGLTMLEVDPSCPELIADFEQVLRDGQGKIKKSRKPNDPYYRRSHLSDAIGYWISYEAPVEFAHSNRITRGRRSVPRPSYGFSKGK